MKIWIYNGRKQYTTHTTQYHKQSYKVGRFPMEIILELHYTNRSKEFDI